MRLETGNRQQPAMALYESFGFQRIPAFGEYTNDPTSVCYEKRVARMRTIETANLTLEPQTAAHAAEMYAVLSDPAIYAYENEPPPSVTWLRERFERLETRLSGDGREQWLNWVIRLPTSELIGYVQATVRPNGDAAIAYVLSSSHWGRGLARRATEALIRELIDNYEVTCLTAVAKRENLRSVRLLERLGFSLAEAELHARHRLEPDEVLMCLNAR